MKTTTHADRVAAVKANRFEREQDAMASVSDVNAEVLTEGRTRTKSMRRRSRDKSYLDLPLAQPSIF